MTDYKFWDNYPFKSDYFCPFSIDFTNTSQDVLLSWFLLQFQQTVAYNTVCVIGLQHPWVWSTCNLSKCTHRARFLHDHQGCSGCVSAQQTGWARRQCCVWPDALNALGLAEHPLFEECWQASAKVVTQRGNDLEAQINFTLYFICSSMFIDHLQPPFPLL